MRAPLRRRLRVSCLASALSAGALLAAACGGPPVDLKKGLDVELVSSGWFDAGIVNGKNKLVPTASIRLKNVSDQTLAVLQINALFRRINEQEEWGSAFMTVAGPEGLAPGAATETLTIRSQLGYTGTESRAEMLENAQFTDAKVNLFAKYGSTQWTPIAEYPIERRLLTR